MKGGLVLFLSLMLIVLREVSVCVLRTFFILLDLQYILSHSFTFDVTEAALNFLMPFNFWALGLGGSNDGSCVRTKKTVQFRNESFLCFSLLI